MRRFILSILLTLVLCGVSHAATHMLFIADQNSATIEGELYTFYELSVGATTYRIGTGNVPEPQATTYNYYRVDLYSLASEGSTHLLDVIMPDGYVGVAKQADEFTAWSYTDLAARVANGQVGVAVIKKFLRVRYTADGEAKTDTIENYEADPATEKVWIKAYIPHKWYGGRYEHFE